MILFVIPHYPSQTHGFFRREIQALERLGVPSRVLSTRRPPQEETCHAWTAEAMAETVYLVPVRPGAALRGILLALGALPTRGRSVWRRMRATRPGGPLGWGRAFAFAFLGAVAAAHARRVGARHLHAHSAADAALVALYAGAWAGLPYSLTLHGRLEDYREAQPAKWGHAAFGIAVTRRLRDELLQALPGLPPDRIHVASMGADTELFRRAAPWRPPGEGEPVRIVTCGRLHRTKGHQDLVDAVANLRAGGADARLEIIGEGPDRRLVEDRVRERGVADHVKLAGALDAAVVRERFEGAHFFALASREEAIGVATMEAMAMEMPVVVTGVGGVSELVRDGQDGVLVPPEDPAAMAAAIRGLMRDPERARALGASGAARVRESFHPGVSAALLARLVASSGDRAA